MCKFQKATHFFSLFLFLLLVKCSNTNEIDDTTLNQLSRGGGFFLYNYNASNDDKTFRVYYHIPENVTSSSPILMVFHGVNRNAQDYRDAFINTANIKNVIVIAPEFSEQNFPNGDGYALGNVYVDGDNPSSTTLNLESQWSLSIVEPLFDYVKIQLQNTNNTYSIFGHSAGAQFTHRFLMFKPNNRARKSVISAAGWYTFPNITIPFPYGLKNSILDNSLTNSFYSKEIFIQVGALDNNPNDSNLRHNIYADVQGLHRLERAINYFYFCKQQAESNSFAFNWTQQIHENADHNYILASQNASNLLFN